MKTKIPLILSCILSLFIILSFTSCPDESIRGVNNIDDMPTSYQTLAFVHGSSDEGTVDITATSITITLGSNPTSFGTDAFELNTDLALAEGYTIDDELYFGNHYILTFTKSGSPKIGFTLYTYSDYINVEKFVDDILDPAFETTLTW
ncbi:MAG: hypothetical protein WC162_10975 [Sphaerochaetaceae bacterium]